MKDDKLYLIHMSECIERIQSYTKDGYEAFMRSRLSQDAVVRNFEVMGEAAKQVSETLKNRYTAIPWKRVAGLRDILIHNYIAVDYDEVWKIVEQDLPVLRETVKQILES